MQFLLPVLPASLILLIFAFKHKIKMFVILQPGEGAVVTCKKGFSDKGHYRLQHKCYFLVTDQ